MPEEPTRAAIFRVEGTLTARPRVSASTWLTLNAQRVTDRFARLSGAALSAGLGLLAPALGDAQSLHRLAWAGLRGMSADRLAVLGEEYWERFVAPNVKPLGIELAQQARRDGHRVVLVSELLEEIALPLVALVGADELIANRMEMRRGRATGRLRDPVVGGQLSGQWARRWAAERDIDLLDSRGYAAQGADALLLSALGHPCAVDPDFRLRRMAKDHDWPVIQS